MVADERHSQQKKTKELDMLVLAAAWRARSIAYRRLNVASQRKPDAQPQRKNHP